MLGTERAGNLTDNCVNVTMAVVAMWNSSDCLGNGHMKFTCVKHKIARNYVTSAAEFFQSKSSKPLR